VRWEASPFRASRDYALLRSVYEGVDRAARFPADFRDERTKLPLMSYDLWEERLGVHAFTMASVVAGLRAAAQMMFDSNNKYFYRMINLDGEVDPTVDSSALSLMLLGVVDPMDPRAKSTAQVIRSRLWVPTIGGIARYENDQYQRESGDYSKIPGNPWLISTMWLAQYYALVGERDEARKLLEWARSVATPTGLLPEQVNPFDRSPLSVMPLAWSHAEYLRALRSVRQPGWSLHGGQRLMLGEFPGAPAEEAPRGFGLPEGARSIPALVRGCLDQSALLFNVKLIAWLRRDLEIRGPHLHKAQLRGGPRPLAGALPPHKILRVAARRQRRHRQGRDVRPEVASGLLRG